MEFGTSISHPLLRVVVGVGEATIRQACGRAPGLEIHVEMDQFQDGREGLRVTLRAPGALTGFSMLLRKYFDRDALWRVAQHAWLRRIPCGSPHGMPRAAFGGVSMN
jgi:hypothetical protein